MKKKWITKYENHKIEVINTWFDGEMLIVDNEIQDHRFGLFGSDLTGHIINANGERKNIKVNISGAFTISCRIFVDDKKMTAKKME